MEELKPCYECGGKLQPVQSSDGVLNALYCENCQILHMFNDQCGSMDATIEQYNRLYDEQTGANDDD